MNNSYLGPNKIIIDNKDWIIEKAHLFCRRHHNWAGYASAFLIAAFVNVWSDPSVKDILQLLNRMFLFERSITITIFSWIALSVTILIPVGQFVAEKYVRSRTYEQRLAILYSNKIDPLLRPFQKGHIGWGLGLTLQSCPNIKEGWSTNEVRIDYRPIEYDVARMGIDVSQKYDNYLQHTFPTLYSEDRTRLMLLENPVAFTDMFPLTLKVGKTKWSQFQFYHELISEEKDRRVRDIKEVIENNKIEFPNSLCLHLIVRTKDHKFLLTKSNKKKGGDYHDVWALSIGEQLDKNDIENDGDCILNWTSRALWEELKLGGENFLSGNIRVMAVNLEGDINNFALATIVVLNLNSWELDNVLKVEIPADREFENWTFISPEDMPKELINPTPTRNYHPSTGIRMFYAGLFEFGPVDLNQRLLRARMEETS